MSQKHYPNTILPRNKQTQNRLMIERQVFLEQSKKSEEQFYKSNDNSYYIISTKFLAEWEKMVSTALQKNSQEDIVTPDLMNVQLIQSYLKDFDEYQLKKQIVQGIHFKFYNINVMNVFVNYPGEQIIRRAYWNGVDKKVQMYPIQFQFVFMSQNWAEILRNNKQTQIPILHSQGYKNETILDLLYRLVQYSKKNKKNRHQFYRNNSNAKVYLAIGFDPKQYARKVAKESYPQSKMEPPGIEIKNDRMIGDLQIPKQPYTLIVQLYEDKWLYKSQDSEQDRCQYCRQSKKLPVDCRCKQVKYCSKICQQKDWRFHGSKCPKQFQQQKQQPSFQIKQNSKLGLVGLANLGNTCFMNAALQCMIHTKGLTQYIFNKLYVDEINEKNPIGSQGKLIRSYARFINSVMTTQESVVTPTRLKYSAGKVKQMFSGFEQHDSQQFLLFMLDTLHQDLNRVLKKPFTQGVQNQGRPDQVVARESWITYLKRNQSIINDLMGGQYRSQVKCPDCNRISVTFDPYLIFAVPIPSSEAKSINLYYFLSNFNSETLKMTLTSKNNLVKQLIQDTAQKSKTDVDQILFFVSGFNGSVRKVDDNQTVDRLTNEKQLNQNSEEKQLFAMQFQPQELKDLSQKKWLIFKFITRSGDTLTFKKPFPMRWKYLKGHHLYDRIYQYHLNLWSKSQKKVQGKQRQAKLKVFKTKMQQQKQFKIYMAYGPVTENKNKLTYQNRIQIQQNTDVQDLLEKTNFEVQFEVQFAQRPSFNYNSYRTYVAENSSSSNHYDYGQGPKTGADQIYTLQQCLQQMKKAQKLVEGNEVFCSHCKDLKLAQKKMELYKASKYLVMQLRRFKQIGYEKTKNYSLVKFPSELDLSQYILSPTVPETYFINDQKQFIKPKYWKGYDKSTSTKYKLYGVVNHHGSLGGGHYTAFANHKGTWYKFDDSEVTAVQSSNIVSSAAYLLFYQRIQ